MIAVQEELELELGAVVVPAALETLAVLAVLVLAEQEELVLYMAAAVVLGIQEQVATQ